MMPSRPVDESSKRFEAHSRWAEGDDAARLAMLELDIPQPDARVERSRHEQLLLRAHPHEQQRGDRLLMAEALLGHVERDDVPAMHAAVRTAGEEILTRGHP